MHLQQAHRALVAASVAVTALVGPLLGQDPRMLPIVEDPLCSMAIDTVVTMGHDQASTPLLSFRSAVVPREPTGWVAAPVYEPGRMALYDQRGDFERGIGVFGEGPGEFSRVTALARARSDSVLLYDGDLHVVSLESGRGRMLRLPFVPYGFSVLDERGFLAQGPWMQTGASGAELVHWFDWEGHHVSSFGGAGEPVLLSNPDGLLRRMAPSRSGDVWLARVDRHDIRRWNATRGEAMTGLFREDTPPGSRIVDLHEDEEGRLWVVTKIDDPEWSGRAPEREVSLAEREARQVERFDFRIEVVDPTTGQVLAHQRFDESVRGFVGEGVILTKSLNRVGVVIASLLRVGIDPTSCATPEGRD